MSDPIANYVSNLTAQVNAVQSCAALQATATAALAALNAQVTALEARIAAMTPALALLTPPATNPGAIVTWITTLIDDYLGPQLAAVTTMTLQAAEITAAIATLSAAISSKASQFENCTITI